MAATSSASQYDSFAADYHWLFSDSVLTGEPFYEEHKELLESLKPGSQILDCACGIGVQALALARHGYCIQGSDASESMIAQANKRARSARIEVPFAACSWKGLPYNFGREFDAVFCCGNAIGHCTDEAEMIDSLAGTFAVLKDGGLLVVNSRNWEKLRAERPRFHAMSVRNRNGQRCIPLYVWNFPQQWHEPHVVEVVLIFEQQGRTTYRGHEVTYFPFHVEDLVARMRAVGLVDVETDYDQAKDGYRVTGRRG